MTKKTIYKKLPTIDNNVVLPKKRGRKPKAKITQEKLDEIKNIASENIAKVDFTEMLEKEIIKIENDMKEETEKLQQQLDYTLQKQKMQIAQTKFRTKYMQLEHERQAWYKAKTELLDIISKLRSLAIQYAPIDEVFEVAGKITEISKKTNSGKKPLEMPN